MNTQHRFLPDTPVRSKGQATLHPDGVRGFPATIREISLCGIGVAASEPLAPGAFVRIDIHGHAAHGVVNACREENAGFYIGIAFDPSTGTEKPAA